MSASLRSAAPAGTRSPVAGPGRSIPPMQRSAAHDRRAGLPLDGISRHAEQEAPAEGPQGPSSQPGTPDSGLAVRDRCPHSDPGGPGERAERSSGDLLVGRMARPRARSGSRFGHRRGVAGLVAVCVLALGVAACSVRDAKAEASASASASASAAIARAEKGIADANASATASREAALTPELRAKRDAALAEPAPAKPEQMNDQTREGAAMTAWYFLELYRYAYMTGNTTELAKMSDDRCQFCKSVIDRATKLHQNGGWADKWDQEITNYTYYEKIDGYDYNELDVTINHDKMISHPGGDKAPVTSDRKDNEVLDFAIRYNGTRWMIGEVEVINS